MGNCRFCGEPAGLFRSKHAECQERYSRAVARLSAAAQNAVTGKMDLAAVTSIANEAKSDHVQQADIRQAIIRGWEAAVDHFLDDGLLEPTEEHRLVTFQSQWSLTQDELDSKGALTKLVQAGVLRDLMEGTVPSRITVYNGNLPFNFQKGEQLIWVFQKVEYLEDKTRREYVGRSSGVSVRIAKGLYYRTGGFRGHPIERTERVSLGRGLLAVTTKHIYFAGPKNFRIRHDKIVTTIPYSDGVAVVKDTATAKPQVFLTGDGWFIFNLLTNVNQL